jgi:MoaA/NifB/PqqE/SkfB family radical SAM enzyme
MSSRRTVREAVSLGLEAVSVFLQHNLIEPFRSRPSLPRAMHFISTHRCNARCTMCGIWKEKSNHCEEMSTEELDRVFSDRLFSRMEYVGISGGEPFLREDLLELSSIVLERCRSLKRLSLTTNGLLPARIQRVLPELMELTRRAGALLDVSVSVHGMGEVLDAIYGVTGAFERTRETLSFLHQQRAQDRLSFSINSVLLADNIAVAGELEGWAKERSIPISFVAGERRERFFTEGLESAFLGSNGERDLIRFFRERRDDPKNSASSVSKYRELVAILEGRKKRSLACYYAMGGLLLGHDGSLYYCSHSREIGNCLDRPAHEIYFDSKNLEYRSSRLLDGECLTCPPYTRTRWEIEKDLPRTLAEAIRKRVRRSVRDR